MKTTLEFDIFEISINVCTLYDCAHSHFTARKHNLQEKHTSSLAWILIQRYEDYNDVSMMGGFLVMSIWQWQFGNDNLVMTIW